MFQKSNVRRHNLKIDSIRFYLCLLSYDLVIFKWNIILDSFSTILSFKIWIQLLTENKTIFVAALLFFQPKIGYLKPNIVKKTLSKIWRYISGWEFQPAWMNFEMRMMKVSLANHPNLSIHPNFFLFEFVALLKMFNEYYFIQTSSRKT